MVGIVIASHGRLADEMLATAKLIVGELSEVIACSIDPAASLDEIQRSIGQAVKRVDGGDGVIVFADLVGGTPCNQSLSLCREARIEVLTGVNLPMLLKAHAMRGHSGSLPDLAHQLAQYGQRNIVCATDGLRAVS
jgi:PTS system mannose-specific IIA component